jgi:hypothetical protein
LSFASAWLCGNRVGIGVTGGRSVNYANGPLDACSKKSGRSMRYAE